MAEFIRKKRFFKYNDKYCKEFLRKDFAKKCAYCKIREGDLAGPENFEKDHFFPISKGGEDKYDNLYYACKSCNGKSGKSDNWSSMLLDPCKDDIWDVHVKVNANFVCEELSDQGDEYIKTFKLNRKSYIDRRRIISNHQKELRDKVLEYERLCQQLVELGSLNGVAQSLWDDVQEYKKIIELGVNHRFSEEVHDEGTDEKVYSALKKMGTVEYVDKDYDLFYELITTSNKYFCNVEVTELAFDSNGVAQKYISIEKLRVWEIINKQEKILIIIFNRIDQEVYVVSLDEILKSSGINNANRCAYYVKRESKAVS